MHLQCDLVVRQIFSDSFLYDNDSKLVPKDFSPLFFGSCKKTFQGLVLNLYRTGTRLKISVWLRDHTVISHSKLSKSTLVKTIIRELEFRRRKPWMLLCKYLHFPISIKRFVITYVSRICQYYGWFCIAAPPRIVINLVIFNGNVVALIDPNSTIWTTMHLVLMNFDVTSTPYGNSTTTKSKNEEVFYCYTSINPWQSKILDGASFGKSAHRCFDYNL